jgi:hypothetical protein
MEIHKERIRDFLYGIPREKKDRLFHQIKFYRVLGIFNAFVGEYNSIEEGPIKPSLMRPFYEEIIHDEDSTLYQMPRYTDRPNNFFWLKEK